MSDPIDRLIRTFREQAASASVARKLDVLIELDGSHDGRVIPFLVEVLVDDQQPTQVRAHALKRVRNGGLTPEIRVRVAEAIGQLVVERWSADLRLRAVIALGQFTDVPGVVPVLGGIALDQAAPIELRYGAFTSLVRAGPTPEYVNLLRQLLNDEALGLTARSALLAWRVPEEES